MIHDLQLAEYGGSEGIRDTALLESPLAKLQNLFAYAPESASLTRMAAAYAFGIARDHAFVDGNKRTALIVSLAFLQINGCEIDAAEEETYLTFLHLAEGRLNEEQLSSWLDEHATYSPGK